MVLVLDALPKHCKDPKLAAYVHSMYGSVEGCRKAVLLDFFRHAFDGSGADNFVSPHRLFRNPLLHACGNAFSLGDAMPITLLTGSAQTGCLYP